MPTSRIPLTFDIESRVASTAKDSRLVNAVVEGDEVVKRPGLVALPLTGSVPPTSQGQGLFSWNNYLIAGFSNIIYKIVGLVSSTLGTIVGTVLPLSFTKTANDTYLVFHNGTNLYVIDKATSTLTSPLSGSAVISATVNSNSVYYVVPPSVTFTGGGGAPQATGTAVLFNHQVQSITINTPGTYTGIPSITIGNGVSGVQAVITANYTPTGSHNQETLTSVTINTAGSGYLVAPPITFPDSVFGQPATGHTVIDATTGVVSVVITYAGLYSLVYPPGTSCIVGPPSATSAATATANMSNTITGLFAAGIVYLDGSVYVMNKTTGAIYGSGINDPTSWNALNKIIAGSDTDKMVGLARHLNYIVAFGTIGTEFFYDAVGPAPASPLANNLSAFIEIGCANGYSIAEAEQTVIWVGTSVTEGRSVYVLEGLSPVKVSNRYIDKYLNKDAMVNVRAYCFKISGHTLYVLTLTDSNLTFVFDLDEKKWYQWTSQVATVEGYFSPTAYDGNLEYAPAVYLQDDDTGKIFTMSNDYYNDNGNSIYLRAVSPLTDSGTTKRKFYQRVEVVGDKVIGTGKIRHSEDDYQTWSSYRNVDLLAPRPVLYQNGQARRRAWEVLITDDIPIRLKALELDFDLGEQGGGQEG
jgi:hypothetical protein